ncbi:MAG: S8 family serine peptidase [Candidatus Riflebacteria bacterium]|nr:S8 family serine peptidase [Candidatus Riflebacteria bacterium]
MRLSRFIPLAMAAAVFFSSCSWASDNSATRWIVKFRSDNSVTKQKFSSSSALIRHLKEQLYKNFTGTRSISPMRGTEMLWVANSVAFTATSEEVKALSADSNVECVFPVTFRKWITETPEKIAVKATRGGEWGVVKIQAPEVWSKLKIDGSGVVVGHIDTGVDGKHEMLADKILAFRDFTPSRSSEAIDDHGHGTHTAGTICAPEGVGVAPGAKLVVARIFDGNGNSSEELILQSMQWMLDPDGNPETNDAPRLVSNSWGGSPEDGSSPSSKTFFEAVQNWVNAGIVPVFAAGNTGPGGNVGAPGCFPNAWAVGSTTSIDMLSFFSSRGPSTWNGESYIKPDVSAPGSNVVSCMPGGGLTKMSGTSMACPHAAGLVALMLQANPKLSINEVREIAESTAKDLGSSGKDNKFGHGRIDAFACISKIVPETPAENIVEGFRMALEAENSLSGNKAVSPLAAPMASYLIEKTRSLDSGEFNSLRSLYSHDSLISSILNEAEASRKFENIHN